MWWAILKTLLLPPAASLLILLAAVLCWHRRLGRGLAVLALASLYLCSVPAVADWLAAGLQQTPPLAQTDGTTPHADAIVILAGSRNTLAPEFSGETVNSLTLERIRYGARLHRESGLPVLVSGGDPAGHGTAEAGLMAEALEADFRTPVRWRENRSRNTEENARFSRDLLANDGVHRIVLVTSALHMPRALASFRRTGFDDVIPAPTGFRAPLGRGLAAWLPDARALALTRAALHEYLGLAWYRTYYRER